MIFTMHKQIECNLYPANSIHLVPLPFDRNMDLEPFLAETRLVEHDVDATVRVEVIDYWDDPRFGAN